LSSPRRWSRLPFESCLHPEKCEAPLYRRSVTEFRWTLHDSSGADLRSSETFASKEDAEAWLGREWSSLADEGAESVSLREGGDVLYRMSLLEE
jgi:hypothetical protein